MSNASISISNASISISNASISNASIAERDKLLMDLQEQIEVKEAQLTQDYKRLLRDVKQNPYLQVAIEEYNTYFKKAKKEKEQKIKMLENLLEGMENQEDRIQIKQEINNIKHKK